MTLEQLQKRIDDIRACAGDDEGAHSMEDTLHRDVLRAIRDETTRTPKKLAALALTTSEIKFERWCA